MGETNRHISQYPLFCFFQLRVCYAVYFHLFGLQLKSIQQTAFDLSPFGKVPPVGPDPDTDDEGISFIDLLVYLWYYEFEFAAGNDDSEDSDSRDEEEEEDEMDAIDANQTPNTNSAATIDTSSPDIFN